jgi:hypothetical protein
MMCTKKREAEFFRARAGRSRFFVKVGQNFLEPSARDPPPPSFFSLVNVHTFASNHIEVKK